MNRAPGVLIADERVVQRSRPVPRLRLLTELEPRHRVFFGNLADLILSRRAPQVFISSRPAAFWHDVFVPSGAPWSSFVESMLGHLLLILLLVWSQSRVWAPVKLFAQRDAFHRSITFSPPAQSFPAVESRVSSDQARPREKATPVRQPQEDQPAPQQAMPVRPEQKPGIVTPPDIKQATSRLPDILASHAVTPMVPFSATAGARRNALAGPSGVVAPPPLLDQTTVDQATARRLALPQASAVAPAPEFAGPPVGRAVKVAGLKVVLPPPSVPSAGGSARAQRLSSLSGTGSNVVPPPPSVQGAGNAAGNARLGSMAGADSRVVPPPPSVQGSGGPGGGTRLGSLSGAGSEVIPPPPSVEGTGSSSVSGRPGSLAGENSQIVPPAPLVEGVGNGAGGRIGSLSGDGSQIVPPPPSVQGSGGSPGGARLGSLSGTGSEVIPPPPSVGGAGKFGAGGRSASLSGGGSQVVPPPPTVGNMGSNGAGGRPGSLSGDGSQVVPPPPSVGGAVTSGGGGRLASLSGDGSQIASPPPSVVGGGNGSGAGGTAKAMDPQPVVASSASSPLSPPTSPSTSTVNSAVNNESKPSVEELPLGLIGLVFAAPGTSFFSNFEVFVAKRRVGKDQLQLIKMVYEFLPYQRRLSEYDLSNVPARVIKLRVTPDPKCDESLGKMIRPYTDPTRGVTQYPKLPEALGSADLNAVLPCYRTTADDFLKAMARAR